MADAPSFETVQQTLCSEIQTLLSLKAGTITPDTDLRPLGIDSLRFVSLLLAIEQKFGVNLMKGGLQREEMQTARRLATVIVARRTA